MTDRTCSIDGCDRPIKGRGWCNKHYQHWYIYGDPLPRSVEDRFWAKVDKAEGCWNWTGAEMKDGYGNFRLSPSKNVRVHRYAYELLVGSAPDDVEVDHRCHNILCVNPQHLRLATTKQNGEHRQGATVRSRSGVRGVYLDRGRWVAVVGHNGKNYHVGRFASLQVAEAAVKAKRNELFTHNDLDREAS